LPLIRVFVLHPHTNFEVLRPYRSERKIWHMLCVCVSRSVTLTFDLLTLKLVRNVARVMGYPPANLVILRLFVEFAPNFQEICIFPDIFSKCTKFLSESGNIHVT